jgi:hypothetical protein
MPRLSFRSGAALALCTIGCMLLFWPKDWASVSVWSVDPTPKADGSYTARGLPAAEAIPGYRLGHAVVASAVFLATGVFIFISGPVTPMPWWRPAVILGAGASVLAIVLIGMNYPYAAFQSDWASGRLVQGPFWGYSNYLSMGAAAGLIGIAAVELRGCIIRRHSSGAEPAPRVDAEPGVGG